VIFMLGGNPGRPGARAWAAAKPNLANVALSRARHGLVIVGDRDEWSQLPYFSAIASMLPEGGRKATLTAADQRDLVDRMFQGGPQP
jgi:hypothetical protein